MFTKKILLTLLCCFTGVASFAKSPLSKIEPEVKQAINSSSNAQPLVLPVDTPDVVAAPAIDSYLVELSTKELAQYATYWWQWVATLPAKENALYDLTGAYCNQNQNGEVWFLAPSKRTASVLRKCTIPAGKYIFFPALAMFQGEKDTGGQKLDCDQMKKRAQIDLANLVELEVVIDKHPISTPKLFLAATGCFNYVGKILKKDRPPETLAASDGYWFMFKPLPVGQHTLSFLVTYKVPNSPLTYVTQRVTYNLTIVPSK